MGKYKSSIWPYIKYVHEWVLNYFRYQYWMVYFYINRNKVEPWHKKNVYIMGKWLFTIHSDGVARRGDQTFKIRKNYKVEVDDNGDEYLFYSIVSMWVYKLDEYLYSVEDVKKNKNMFGVNFSVHVWCGNTAQSWGIGRVLVEYFHSLYCSKVVDWESFSLNYKRGKVLRSLL